MRMWMGISPALLCDKHLLGEHSELHKFKPAFVKQYSISGRVKYPAQICPGAMKFRHDEIVAEMKARKMNHQSPYSSPALGYLKPQEIYPVYDPIFNLMDLTKRCSTCANRIKERAK